MVLHSPPRMRRSTVIGWIFLPLLLLGCVAYYFAIAANMVVYDGDTGLFQFAINSHDRKIYLLNFDLVRSSDDFFELANDKGTGRIYSSSPQWVILGITYMQHARCLFSTWRFTICSETTGDTPPAGRF